MIVSQHIELSYEYRCLFDSLFIEQWSQLGPNGQRISSVDHRRALSMDRRGRCDYHPVIQCQRIIELDLHLLVGPLYSLDYVCEIIVAYLMTADLDASAEVFLSTVSIRCVLGGQVCLVTVSLSWVDAETLQGLVMHGVDPPVASSPVQHLR